MDVASDGDLIPSFIQKIHIMTASLFMILIKKDCFGKIFPRDLYSI